MANMTPLLKRRLRVIRAVVLDVDGVLTDGSMYYSSKGEELKKFNTRDGMAIGLLMEAGVRVALISGEDTEIIKRRAEKLNIVDLYLGIKDKIIALDEFIKKYDLSPDEIAYIGDDLNDIEAMNKVILPVAVNDAVSPVKEVSAIVLERKGGDGAVREFADLLLANR